MLRSLQILRLDVLCRSISILLDVLFLNTLMNMIVLQVSHEFALNSNPSSPYCKGTSLLVLSGSVNMKRDTWAYCWGLCHFLSVCRSGGHHTGISQYSATSASVRPNKLFTNHQPCGSYCCNSSSAANCSCKFEVHFSVGVNKQTDQCYWLIVALSVDTENFSHTTEKLACENYWQFFFSCKHPTSQFEDWGQMFKLNLN